MSSSNSPCAACKFLRRKCTQECDFAPYFLLENPERFANVHRVFGASNVAKLLKELNAADREDAVKSLAYEAEYRIKDPVYGCVSFIWLLQQRLKEIHQKLIMARKELSCYSSNPPNMQYMLANPGPVLSPQQQQQMLQQQWINNSQFGVNPNNFPHEMVGGGGGGERELVNRDFQQQNQEQELLEAQQLALAAQLVAQQEYLLRFGGVTGNADGAHALGMRNFCNTTGGGDGDGGGYYEMQPQQEEQQNQDNFHHHDGVANADSMEPQLLLSPQNQEIGGEDGRSVGSNHHSC